MKFLASVMLLAHLTASLLPVASSSRPAIVKISDGYLQGDTYDDHSRFDMISYAASTAGNLRFKTNLSVTPMVQMPVIVRFHDGGFTDGSGYKWSAFERTMIEQGIVNVFLNYRLGVFGFLNMNHPNATGNQGLKDQVLALKWVQKNIHHFGGNPNNVTIMGIGAGAASVGYHVLSRASAGLFHGAIYMSGTPLAPHSFIQPADAVNTGKALARKIRGLEPDTPLTTEAAMEILYAATDDQLAVHSASLDKGLSFWPTLEDPSIAEDLFLSECLIRSYESGNFNKVPQLIGFKEKDFIANNVVFMINEVTNSENGGVRKLISVPNDALTTTLQSALIAQYKILDNGPIHHTQKLLMENNGENPVYCYERVSTFVGKHSETDNYIDIAHLRMDDGYDTYDDQFDKDNEIAYKMWTNFVKYGNPTPDWIDQGSLNIIWPPAGSSGQALQIGDELKIVPFVPSSVALPNDCGVFSKTYQTIIKDY